MSESTYNEAILSENSGNYIDAFDKYTTSLKNGFTNANTKIGFLYLEGRGVEKNINTAIDYFKGSLEDPFSLLHLANIYYNGIGITINYDQAHDYYIKITELPTDDKHKHIKCEAFTKLAIIYIKGYGEREIDYVKANNYLNTSIQIDNTYGDAYYYLSRIYKRKIKGIKNNERPYEYENSDAKNRRNYLTNLMIIKSYNDQLETLNKDSDEYKSIDTIVADITKAMVIPKNDYKAEYEINLKLYDAKIDDYTNLMNDNIRLAAATNGSIKAIHLLGRNIYNQSNTLQEGVNWLKQSADKGYTPSQYMLGKIYYNSKVIVSAIKYLKMAIENGDDASLLLIICIYLDKNIENHPNIEEANKYGLLRDIEISELLYNMGMKYYDNNDYFIARLFFKKAVSNESFAPALFYLGIIYEKGQDIDVDMVSAINYYKLSAERGYENAQLRLGRMYELGIDKYVKKNLDMAIKYYSLAAERLNNEAYLQLGYIYNINNDFQKSIDNYQLSACYNNAYGQYYMAIHYYNNGKYNEAMFYLYKVIKNIFGGRFGYNIHLQELMNLSEYESKTIYISYFTRKKIATMYMKMEGIEAENEDMKQYYKLVQAKGDDKIARIMIGKKLALIDMITNDKVKDDAEFRKMVDNIHDFTVDELIEIGFTLQQLKDASFTAFELQRGVKDLTVHRLIHELKFTLEELKESNFSHDDLLYNEGF